MGEGTANNDLEKLKEALKTPTPYYKRAELDSYEIKNVMKYIIDKIHNYEFNEDGAVCIHFAKLKGLNHTTFAWYMSLHGYNVEDKDEHGLYVNITPKSDPIQLKNPEIKTGPELYALIQKLKAVDDITRFLSEPTLVDHGDPEDPTNEKRYGLYKLPDNQDFNKRLIERLSQNHISFELQPNNRLLVEI